MLLELGVAVGGGILNALSGAAEDREMNKRKQQALALLKENIIDPDELNLMLSNVNRLFNNRLANTLNSTALRSRGVANAGLVKGAAAGAVEGQRFASLMDVQERVFESNKQTRSQMANVEAAMGSSHNALGDFFSGALGAAPIGMELSKMLAPQDIVANVQPQVMRNGIETPDIASAFTGDLKNPFMGKVKIKDNDIADFGYSKFWEKKPWE